MKNNEPKIRVKPEDHHIWCNFFGRIGVCKICDKLEKQYPHEPDVDLIKKYFPSVIKRD